MLKFKDLTLEVSQIEGKKREVNIAQISEILSIAFSIFYREMKRDPWAMMALIKRHRGKQ